MAVANRYLPEEYGGHFNQYDIEVIQRVTDEWYPDNPLFPQWPAVVDCVDTGERSGLARSVWGGGGGGVEEDSLKHEGMLGGLYDIGSVIEPVPFGRLTHSTKLYAKLTGAGLPELPVATQAEKRKFQMELGQNYYEVGDVMGRQQAFQRVNFDAWAVKWNEHCFKIEKGEVEHEEINRKTAKQLETYYEQYKSWANCTLTMQPVRQGNADLRAQLRVPAPAEDFEDSVSRARPLPIPRRRASQQQGESSSQREGESSGNNLGIAVRRRGSLEPNASAPAEGGGAADGPGGGHGSARDNTRQRRGQKTCQECGHYSMIGIYARNHTSRLGGGCSVEKEKRRPDRDRLGRKHRSSNRRTFLRCKCDDCQAALAAQNAEPKED